MPESQQPNILLILTDQHRLSAVGCYGETPCQTPNIDRLAREGHRFETAYTACPVCSPARATIMTGLYPHQHGICSNVHNLGCSVHELPDGPDLLSRRLQAAGYRCGYTGKWHLGTSAGEVFGAPAQPSLPRDVGFEGQNFPGHGGGGFGYPEYRQYLSDHGWVHEVRQDDGTSGKARCNGIVYGTLTGPVESTVPYFLTDHTIDLIDGFRAGGEPFFMWHNFWGPHGPYYIPKEYYDRYREVEIPEWPNFRWDGGQGNTPHQVKIHPRAAQLSWEDWAEAVRHYYAFTSLIDAQIGRIMSHLEARGVLENTVVIFSADHGETLGSHGGLTDKGWHHFEEIQRVPFIVRLPDSCMGDENRRGSVGGEWVSLLDMYPTILDVAGAEPDCEGMAGRSCLPLLQGGTGAWRDQIVVEFNGVNSLATSMVTMRQGDFKYGWNCSSWDELYDLARDPAELHNAVADAEYAGRLQQMRGLLAEWMEQTGYPGRGMYMQSRMGGRV